MELTKENKEHIDGLTYTELLSRWRFAEAGDPWFQGETGEYWSQVMRKKRDENPVGAVSASKRIGWE